MRHYKTTIMGLTLSVLQVLTTANFNDLTSTQTIVSLIVSISMAGVGFLMKDPKFMGKRSLNDKANGK